MASVWIISDGKPGHYNQSLGLAQALQRRKLDITIEHLAPLTKIQGLFALLRGLFPGSESLSKPDFILAAGHATHLSLLAAGRAIKAKTVVLMRPSLPLSWFDYCLIPQHDNPPERKNIIATCGALNVMRAEARQRNTGILLIGGPSAHFGWNQESLLAQVNTLVKEPREWLLTTSRRTPKETVEALMMLKADNLSVVPFEQTAPGWLSENLPGKEVCWVTADSVSMVFEALTSGCKTGILPVPEIKQTRVVRGQKRLVEQQLVGHYDGLGSSGKLPVASGFNEAERCADIILGASSAGSSFENDSAIKEE